MVVHMDDVLLTEVIPSLLSEHTDKICIGRWAFLLNLVGISCIEELDLAYVSGADG